MRATALTALILLAACARGGSVQSATASPGVGTGYPPGIVAPSDTFDAARRGIYQSVDQSQCCFLADKANLVLDNPPNAQIAVFMFYVPDVKPLRGGTERATIVLDGVTAATPRLQTGMQDISVTIPPAVRGKAHLNSAISTSVSWVPKELGMNADTRRLSILLIKVGYI